jgi:ADP-heptose:LPS heptosyltransferase/predicted SAM-dependent methyltransferase
MEMHNKAHIASLYCQGKGIDVGCGNNEISPDFVGADKAAPVNNAAPTGNLHYDNESMDYVFSSCHLDYSEHTVCALAEWMRILRPGGNLVLCLPHRNFNSPAASPNAVTAHGFNLHPNLVLAALSETNDYDILCIEERIGDGLWLVVRKLHKEMPQRKVLVELHAAIGDCICAEPAVRSLKHHLGNDVAVVLRVTHPELFRNHPSVSRIENIIFVPRRRDYEKVYELSVKPTKQNRRSHLVDRAAEQIGVELIDRTPQIYLDRWDELMLERFHLPKSPHPKIAISPHVNWPSRQWKDEKWTELCRTLIRRFGAVIVELGAAGSYTGGFGVNLVGQTSPRQAAAVLSKCNLLISVDTGLAHLAAAVGTPCVGIFGPIYPELRMHPGLRRSVIAAQAECRGCFHWYGGDVRSCPKGHHECMTLISAEAVLDAVYKVLEKHKLQQLNAVKPLNAVSV